MRRAVSTLLLGFLISSVLLSFFIYMFIDLQGYRTIYTSSYIDMARYVDRYRDTDVDVSIAGDIVNITNTGLRETSIEYLILERNSYLQLNRTSMILRPGDLRTIRLGTWRLICIVTSDGVIIYPRYRNIVTPRANEIRITSISFNNIRYTDDLSKEFGTPLNMVSTVYTRDRTNLTGMKSDKLLLLPLGQQQGLWNSSTPFNVSTDNKGIRFGVVVIGYDPTWLAKNASGINIPPQFRITIAGPPFGGQDKVHIDNSDNPLSGGEGFRLVIYNFSGVIKICKSDCSKSSNVIACSSSLPGGCGNVARNATGFWYYGSTDSTLNLRIYMNGLATFAAYYMRISSQQAGVSETNYNPYIFIGDVDGNGLADIVFTTEDAYYGSYDRIDDLYSNNDLSDWSTVPIRLKLLQVGKALGYGDGSIDGSIYAGVYLLMNIFFHDNSHPDSQQLNDNDRTDWVLRVSLVDGSGNVYVVREYRYQEICNYHKTLIADFANDNYFVKISQSLYIPLPFGGRHWVAIEFQDPYSRDGTENDADITVGVEFIGAIALYR